jgi:hypothetical protein
MVRHAFEFVTISNDDQESSSFMVHYEDHEWMPASNFWLIIDAGPDLHAIVLVNQPYSPEVVALAESAVSNTDLRNLLEDRLVEGMLVPDTWQLPEGPATLASMRGDSTRYVGHHKMMPLMRQIHEVYQADYAMRVA